MKIVFATNNEHKLSEIRSILKDKVEVLSLNDIDCHVDIPETGETLEENALQKAQYIYDHYHMDVFADDTGLEVETLGGAPGVHTARYADEVDHDAEANTRKLLRVLANEDNRKARFRTAIALILNNNESPITKLFEGIVNGEITREKRGEKGFGYDPVFIPEGYDETFAELGVEVKNHISHRARAVQKLVDYLKGILLFFLFIFLPLSISAQIGTWHNYMAYSEVQDICSAGDLLFVQASNDLYSYNLSDQSITTYDKVNGLSDTYITHIKWNTTAKRLLIVYQNQNMDLMEQGGEVTNLSDLFQKTMTDDKTVNSIHNYQQYAYLACGFGIVKVDMQRIEISESYNLSTNITQVAISNGNIFAKAKSGQVLTAALKDNLLDPNTWHTTTLYDASIFNVDRTDYNTYLATVQSLNPGGPKYNNFFNMLVHNGLLYTVGGGWHQFSNFQRPGTIQILNENKEWTIYQDNIKPAFASAYRDVNSIAIDPLDNNHVMVATCSGLYEFMNGEFKKNYTAGNTEYFESAAGNAPDYVRTDGIVYDKEGNLFCLNSEAKTAIIKRSTDGRWSGFVNSQLIDKNNRTMRTMKRSIFDSRGLMWFINSHSDYNAFFCFDTNHEELVKYNHFVNQDGTSIDGTPRCIMEDNNGYIWVGTTKGPFYLTTAEMADQTKGVIQYKVPRNDGTNYADYLLNNIEITCMAIDGGGRKWFGTADNGVYLISADNNTQLQHFTNQNSPLLSNTLESIAINNTTGEVFFGTENGLCSYLSDAIAPADEMTEDNVYAYPNPVTPDYNGLITVVGLTYDADVKILSSNGALIAEGRSTGGMFTWDGKDKNGDRVASGVYMVATATSNGNKGTVCKIVIVK